MQIGTFRRNVGKTLSIKATKMAMKAVSKHTVRAQIAQATVALKGHVGQLVQTLGPYLLGLPQTQEMKEHAFVSLGDIGYDVTALARVLKVKLPSSTKKSKLVGTRGAALLQLDSLTTELLRVVEQGLFVAPAMTTVKKLVTLPQKGGVKEERNVAVVDQEAVQAAEAERQTTMTSFLSGAIDVYWRLCFDMTGQPPVAVLDAKFARMKKAYPAVTFDTGEQPVAPPPVVPVPVAKAKPKKKKAHPEPVTA